MATETPNDYQLPSTPKDRQAIKSASDEIIVQLIRKAAADDQIKAILERMKEELEVPPKFLKKIAAVRFKEETKGNEFDKLVQEQDTFEVAYETLYRAVDEDVNSEE